MRDDSATDREASLAIRAAWLHYAGGLTQANVAKQLGIANVKAHRLIARATQAGAVKVTIEGDVAECMELEAELAERFGLSYCEVTPDLLEDGLPVRALGVAGAAFLKREIENGNSSIIGVGHGRTLAAVVRQLTKVDAGNVKFVSLLGGVNRNYAANPYEVIHRLADRTGATAYVMPVPVFANSVEDREVLLSQRGVQDVFDLAAKSELKFVGIGTAKPDASNVSTGMIEPAELDEVLARGGVGELLGNFFDAGGASVETSLTERTLSVSLEDSRGTRIVAVAGGKEKIGAIRSVLMSGRLAGLITDERTASALVGKLVAEQKTNGRKPTNV
ncbi:MAG: sugar-binding transcriptional regulator [Rhodobacter sp.]|nr:sugar-binding transcriptional regulator [Rhodobacter sp.]